MSAFAAYCQELIEREPADNPSHLTERDAWKCDLCEGYIYNLDAAGRPAPGAPMPLVLYEGKVRHACHTCFELVKTLESSAYMKKLHEEFRLIGKA